MLNRIICAAADADPDAEALVGLHGRWSWSGLERDTAAVAARLVGAGVGCGERVAVCLAKDAASYIAVHGALRAGTVVVPVDPSAPIDVALAVLTDAGVQAVVADRRTLDRFRPEALAGLDLRVQLCTDPGTETESTPPEPWVAWSDVLATPVGPLPDMSGDDPAYLIYTSGSTGSPKGILHTHASAMAYAERAVEAHALGPTDRVAGMSPFHFDMSTLELYAAPLARAAVIAMGEAHLLLPAGFTARAEAERTTVWYSVPSFFRQVVTRGAIAERDLRALRLIMFGGEPYAAGALRELMVSLPHATVKNIYGPAEVNECTNHVVAAPPLDDEDVPIGRPWRDVDVCVVDEMGTPVPAGVPGELLVRAPTAMRGYWAQPDRTARAMRRRDEGAPWYATGDLVVADDAGLLWFRGRRDHQVKVRGVRLELEAIEAVLEDAPGVLHAVAAAVGPPGDRRSVAAAVVIRDGTPYDANAVRRWCVARLPAVAVPRDVVVYEQLPRTPSGKLDRRRVRAELKESRTAPPNGEDHDRSRP